MKAYAPLYYEQFKCIADRCTHSCCVGWRIELDGDTLKKYESAEGEYSESLRRHLARDEGGAYIPTDCYGKCPHLESTGLCRVISRLGEEYLSEICREHPRFYNTVCGRLEVGLGASCPEAARLILESEPSTEIIEIGEDEGECKADGYSVLTLRESLFSILRRSAGYKSAEDEIICMLSIPREVIGEDYRRNIFSKLEYLYPEDWLKICEAVDGYPADDATLGKLLSYFLYRHLAAAECDTHAAAIAGFALLSVRTVVAMAAKCGGVTEALRIYSAEVEYSTDNTDDIILGIESEIV